MDVEAMEPVREAADLPGHGDRAGAGVLEVDGAGRLAASLQDTNCLDHGGGWRRMESGIRNARSIQLLTVYNDRSSHYVQSELVVVQLVVQPWKDKTCVLHK